MWYRVLGGLAFLCLGVTYCGLLAIPSIITGVLFVAAGIALLAGK